MMASETEFRSLYDGKLKAKLESLEAARKAVLNRYLLMILLVVALGGGNFLLINFNPPGALIVTSVVASVVGLIWYIVVTYRQKKAYRANFKNNVVAEIVRLYNPEWQYNCDSCVSQADYEYSRLFPHHVDRYEGDDLVCGSIDKTDFRFSELHTQYKQVTHGAKGQRQEHWVTIFRGLFMHADFNKNFSGVTFVLPDTAERLFGSFGQTLQGLSSRGELVKLENVDFEKRFVVYSSDQVEARYILTPTVMEAMVNMAARSKREIYFSFVGSRVYFARTIYEDLFEPNVFRSGVNYADAKEMFDMFGMISELVQELNLNTRIWTKA